MTKPRNTLRSKQRIPRVAVALAAIAACVLVDATAGQAAVWSAPQTLSRTHTAIFTPMAGATASDTGVVSWNWQDGLGNGSSTGASFTSRPVTSTAYRAERELPKNTVVAKPYAAQRLVVAVSTPHGRQMLQTLSVRFGDLAGHFGPAQPITRTPRFVSRVKLAVNEVGDSVLAWSEDRRRVYASVRRRGGRFGPAIQLGAGAIRDVSAAAGPSGDLLVAWDARGRVLTRFKRRATTRFEAAQQLRSEKTFAAALQTAVSAGGRGWVAWSSQLLSEGGDRGDAYIQAARRAAGARRFDRAVLLDHAGSEQTPSAVSLSIDPAGDALVAWSMAGLAAATQPTFTAVSVAKLNSRGMPSTTVVARFPSVDVGYAQAAYADDGSATAVWTQPLDPAAGTTQALASRAPRGGAWGAAELVSAGPGAFSPVVTYPSGSVPGVVLANRLPCTSGTVMQAVTRLP